MTTPAEVVARPSAPRSLRWGALAVALGLVALGGYFGLRWLQDRADRREALELAGTNHFDAAEPVLRRVQEQHPEDVEVVRALALGYLDARQFAEAETFLGRWCELRPGETEPYQRRLELWSKQQKLAQALADVGHILQIDPDNSAMRLQAAQLLLLVGRPDQAERECLRCLKAQPNNVELWYLLARSEHDQGRDAEATGHADRVLQSSPDFTAGLELRAELHLAAGQPDPAIALLRRAADKPGREQAAALYQLGVTLDRVGRHDEGKKVLAEMRWRQALGLWSEDEHRDDNAALQERVVEAFEAAGKTDDAVRFLTDILKRNPRAPAGTHQLLAACYEKLGQPERAAEHRRRAGSTP
jgi:predicted Zn-dependent protease